jgi:hypothetical protein
MYVICLEKFLSSQKPNKQCPHTVLNMFLPKQSLHVRVSPEKENTHGGRYKDIDDSSMVLVEILASPCEGLAIQEEAYQMGSTQHTLKSTSIAISLSISLLTYLYTIINRQSFVLAMIFECKYIYMGTHNSVGNPFNQYF